MLFLFLALSIAKKKRTKIWKIWKDAWVVFQYTNLEIPEYVFIQLLSPEDHECLLLIGYMLWSLWPSSTKWYHLISCYLPSLSLYASAKTRLELCLTCVLSTLVQDTALKPRHHSSGSNPNFLSPLRNANCKAWG